MKATYYSDEQLIKSVDQLEADWKRLLPNEDKDNSNAERFIVLTTREPFDYTKWRESILNENISIRELSQKAMAYSKNL